MSEPIIPDELQLSDASSVQLDMATVFDDSGDVLDKLMRGELTQRDELTLRKLLGLLSFAQWVDHTDRGEPFRVRDARLLELLQLRAVMRARQRMLARVAPWLLMPEVRS